VYRSPCKVPSFLSDCKDFLSRFSNNTPIWNVRKSVQWEPSCSIGTSGRAGERASGRTDERTSGRAGGRMERQTEANSRFSPFFESSWMIQQSKLLRKCLDRTVIETFNLCFMKNNSFSGYWASLYQLQTLCRVERGQEGFINREKVGL
jgi:hypothetical protein